METKQHHVLYIEDHDDTRELVTLVLSERYRVTTGATILDALKLAREHHFDLYMLDSWLPDGSGIELCKQLREFDQATPIMFLSAAAYETDKQAAMDSGAQHYMVKPADIQGLSNEVNALISASAKKPDHAGGRARSHSPLRGSTDDREMRSRPQNLAGIAT